MRVAVVFIVTTARPRSSSAPSVRTQRWGRLTGVRGTGRVAGPPRNNTAESWVSTTPQSQIKSILSRVVNLRSRMVFDEHLSFSWFEVNSNLSNRSKAKVTTSMTLHYLSVVIDHW